MEIGSNGRLYYSLCHNFPDRIFYNMKMSLEIYFWDNELLRKTFEWSERCEL